MIYRSGLNKDYQFMIKILVVEDRIILRRKIAGRLRTKFPGILIMEAFDEASCLNILAREVIQIIIIELRLAQRYGLEVVQKIKKINKDIFIIVNSIYDSNEYRKLASKMGSDYFLSKVKNNLSDMIALVKIQIEKSAFRM